MSFALITLSIDHPRLKKLQRQLNDPQIKPNLLQPHITIIPPFQIDEGSGVDVGKITEIANEAPGGTNQVQVISATIFSGRSQIYVLEASFSEFLADVTNRLRDTFRKHIKEKRRFRPHITLGYSHTKNDQLLKQISTDWVGKRLPTDSITIYTRDHGSTWQTHQKIPLA